MTNKSSTNTNVLILTSDAGSGHRSAANAIEHALRARGLVAVVANPAHHALAPHTLVEAERFYLSMVHRAPDQYALAHSLTDAPGLDLFLEYSLAGALRKSLAALVLTHQPDVVISVYPLFTRIISSMLQRKNRPRLMTVVTDLGNVHRAWFNQADDCVAVPTLMVRDKALKCGIDIVKVVHTGLPINPVFGRQNANKTMLRQQLGWDLSLPTLVLLSGGAGIGPVAPMAEALDASPHTHQLVIVAGRNQQLAAQLRAYQWHHRTHIYDFVPLVDVIHAADVIASKAGGLTVSECLAAGKPMVFFGDAPGQEEGNRNYVVSHGAGLVASDAQAFADYATTLLSSDPLRTSMAYAARQLGMPEAASTIADEVERLMTTPTPRVMPRLSKLRSPQQHS
jgi:1,2-diacylglycerol 3-beta-galactosyltransferase